MPAAPVPGPPAPVVKTLRRSHRPVERNTIRWPWLLVAAAWAAALLATLSGHRELVDHHYLLEESSLPWLLAVAVFLLCWQVMLVAMMLPSSMPLIKMVIYASRRQARPVAVQAAFLAGYAVVWTAFAVAAFVGDTAIHHAVDAWPWLAAHSFVIGAVTFAIAGAFQFSPLKERCLSACRTPLSFFARHYREGAAPAWRLGVRHGLFCLGCCWALMLVMFGVGVGSLGWMAGLAGVMVIEKAIPGGRRIGPFVGVALLVLAVIWCLHPAWLVPATVS
jgi:predicted metal-binding membrane protein